MRCRAGNASALRSAAPSCAIPKVFLFDEPLSNLDAALRVGMRGELIKLHQRLGATMIYVTHDQVEAMTMGDRICIMNGGKVVQIGAPLEVYRDPADTFVASFLGSPPTNLLPRELRRRMRSSLATATLPLHATAPAAERDLRHSPGGHPHRRREAPHAHGEVLAVEPLGAETIVRLRLPGVASDVLVRGPRTSAASVGDRAADRVRPRRRAPLRSRDHATHRTHERPYPWPIRLH